MVEWWPRRGAHSHYSPTRPAHYMCYAWGEGGSAARALFLKKKPFFHFRALLTEEMKKEHAHINGGGCNKLATCLLSSSFCLEMPFIIFSFFASAPAHYTCAFIPTCVKTWPAVHTPPKPCSRRAGTPCSSLLPLTHSILHPLSSHVYRLASRLS